MYQPSRSVPVVSIVGRSNSGKTTLLKKLICELKKRGKKVGTIKSHAHNDMENELSNLIEKQIERLRTSGEIFRSNRMLK